MFSVKRLMEHLRISENEAIMVHAVLSLKPLKRGERFPVLETNSPGYELEHDSASRKLYIINRLLDGFHGVEIIRSNQDDMHTFRGISYLNTGDSYGATVMRDHGRHKWLLTSWGDVIENPRNNSRFGSE
jgi:hypothetical protein